MGKHLSTLSFSLSFSPDNPPVRAQCSCPMSQSFLSRSPPVLVDLKNYVHLKNDDHGKGLSFKQPEHTRPLLPLWLPPNSQLLPASWTFTCWWWSWSWWWWWSLTPFQASTAFCLMNLFMKGEVVHGGSWTKCNSSFIIFKWIARKYSTTCDCQWEVLRMGSQWKLDKAPSMKMVSLMGCDYQKKDMGNSCINFLQLHWFTTLFVLTCLWVAFICMFCLLVCMLHLLVCFLYLFVCFCPVLSDKIYLIRRRYLPHVPFPDRPISLSHGSDIDWCISAYHKQGDLSYIKVLTVVHSSFLMRSNQSSRSTLSWKKLGHNIFEGALWWRLG